MNRDPAVQAARRALQATLKELNDFRATAKPKGGADLDIWNAMEADREGEARKAMDAVDTTIEAALAKCNDPAHATTGGAKPADKPQPSDKPTDKPTVKPTDKPTDTPK